MKRWLYLPLVRLIKAVTGVSPRNVLAAFLPIGPQVAAPAVYSGGYRESVLVLAPHADDEAIGCGGALALHAMAGSRIHIVFLTDGSLGGQKKRPMDVIATRKAEAQKSVDYLRSWGGEASLHFLGATDGSLQVHSKWVDELHTLIAKFLLDVVYVPFVLDHHEDHWNTNLILLAAINKLDPVKVEKVQIRCYEVWAPLPANLVLDISSVKSKKDALVRCHASQLEVVDYLHAVNGLNAYRSLALPNSRGKGFAEAFYACDVPQYTSLVQKVRLS